MCTCCLQPNSLTTQHTHTIIFQLATHKTYLFCMFDGRRRRRWNWRILCALCSVFGLLFFGCFSFLLEFHERAKTWTKVSERKSKRRAAVAASRRSFHCFLLSCACIICHIYVWISKLKNRKLWIEWRDKWMGCK